MNEQQPTHSESLMREKALYRYMDALERGDFQVMARILQQAERDPELDTMIWEVQRAYLLEQETEQQEDDIMLVRQLLQKHLPSGFAVAQDMQDVPPLTVSDVVARMQADEVMKGNLKDEIQGVVQQLRQSTVPLPSNLGVQGIRDLFVQLGVRASKRIHKLFSETALFLSAGRAQGMAQLAATRRQQEKSRLSDIQQKEQQEEEQS
jgi:hypothetical protein